MSIRKRLVKGTLWMLVMRAYSMVLMLVLNACLTRWMLPGEVASYIAATNVMIFASFVGMAGLNQSMLRLVAGRKSNEVSNRELIGRCWKLAAGFTLLVTAVTAALLYSRPGEWLNLATSVVAAVLICSVLVSVHKLLSASLRSVHALSASGILEGRSGGPLANTMFFGLLLLLTAFSVQLTAPTALMAFAAALLVTGPLGFWMLNRSLKAADSESETAAIENVDGASAENILIFSTPFLAFQVLTYFAAEFDVLLASAYTSPEDTALFGTARRLILQTLAPVQILSASMASTIAQLYAQRDREKLSLALRYSATVGCVLTIPLLIVCIAIPDTILRIVFSDFYGGGGFIFAVMAIGQIAVCLSGQSANLLMMSGRTTILLAIKGIAAGTMIIVGALAAKHYGVRGLAITSSAIVATQAVATWIASRASVGYWTHPTFRPRKPKKNQ